MARPRSRPDLHERFARIVARAIAKAERDHAEHLARLRPGRRQTAAEAHRAAGRIVFRPRRTPTPEPTGP